AQEVAHPFRGLHIGNSAIRRSACFPYPGNVTVELPCGPIILGDVVLCVALWLEVETVTLEQAGKHSYASPTGEAVQRVEFTSQEPRWGIDFQSAEGATGIDRLKVRYKVPEQK